MLDFVVLVLVLDFLFVVLSSLINDMMQILKEFKLPYNVYPELNSPMGHFYMGLTN